MGDVLICAPVRTGFPPAGAMVPGSVILTADCGHDVWVAPSGQRMLAGMKLFCTDCAPALLEADPGPIMPPNAEQLGEIVELLKRGLG